MFWYKSALCCGQWIFRVSGCRRLFRKFPPVLGRVRIMARVCQVTGKRPVAGNNVSHAEKTAHVGAFCLTCTNIASGYPQRSALSACAYRVRVCASSTRRALSKCCQICVLAVRRYKGGKLVREKIRLNSTAGTGHFIQRIRTSVLCRTSSKSRSMTRLFASTWSTRKAKSSSLPCRSTQTKKPRQLPGFFVSAVEENRVHRPLCLNCQKFETTRRGCRPTVKVSG